MNFYENILIFDPNLDDKTIEDSLERVKNLVIKNGGEILKSENWGHKKLAYELKKQHKGVYMLLLFKTPSSTIAELEKFYKLFDPLLEFMVIKLKKKEIEAALSSISEAKSNAPDPGRTNIETSPSGEKEKNV